MKYSYNGLNIKSLEIQFHWPTYLSFLLSHVRTLRLGLRQFGWGGGHSARQTATSLTQT